MIYIHASHNTVRFQGITGHIFIIGAISGHVNFLFSQTSNTLLGRSL